MSEHRLLAKFPVVLDNVAIPLINKEFFVLLLSFLVLSLPGRITLIFSKLSSESRIFDSLRGGGTLSIGLCSLISDNLVALILRHVMLSLYNFQLGFGELILCVTALIILVG